MNRCNANCSQGRSCDCLDRAVTAYWDDTPIPPDEAEGWALAGLAFLALVTLACIAGAVIAFANY